MGPLHYPATQAHPPQAASGGAWGCMYVRTSDSNATVRVRDLQHRRHLRVVTDKQTNKLSAHYGKILWCDRISDDDADDDNDSDTDEEEGGSKGEGEIEDDDDEHPDDSYVSESRGSGGAGGKEAGSDDDSDTAPSVKRRRMVCFVSLS